MDEFEHECYMLCVKASETRAKDDVVCKSYERIRNEFVRRIAAMLENGMCEIKNNNCTKCGHEINNDAYYVRIELGGGTWTAESREANFCPNCGRKVRR
jgi:predicted RNA-binding Zn-ribbon protein involved in translation (DUF1610 family)